MTVNGRERQTLDLSVCCRATTTNSDTELYCLINTLWSGPTTFLRLLGFDLVIRVHKGVFLLSRRLAFQMRLDYV